MKQIVDSIHNQTTAGLGSQDNPFGSWRGSPECLDSHLIQSSIRRFRKFGRFPDSEQFIVNSPR